MTENFGGSSAGTPTVQDAFAYCERMTYGHYENFPVASFLIPRRQRKHIAAIYAFARTADDFADEPGRVPEERLRLLDDWSSRLDRCYAGEATDPVFVALRETIREFGIPADLLKRLLAAFRSDVATTRYESFDDLRAYCRNSADPVGRLVLHLFGYQEAAQLDQSDRICTALQLANFWQDVTVDLEKDRVYLPLQDLRSHNVSEEEVFSRKTTPAFRSLMAFEVGRTKALFEEGRPLLDSVGRDLKMELRLTWYGGMRILERIEDMDFEVLHHRPTLTRRDKLRLLIRSLVG